jgi:hypothetical protein
MTNKTTPSVAVLNFASLVALLDGNKSCRFISLVYRAKETGELARHNIMLNIRRESMLKHDVALLKAKLPTLSGLDKQACEELIASMEKSLNGTQDGYTKAGYYEAQGNGNVQVSVKDECFIRGYSLGKEVIEPGTYKKVNSRPLTIAKDKLRKGLKNTKCREFKITPENFVMARHDGKAIVIDATATSLNKLASLPPVTLAVPVAVNV